MDGVLLQSTRTRGPGGGYQKGKRGKEINAYGRYDTRNENHRVLCRQPTGFHCVPNLKFSSVVVEFPDFRNALAKARPFSFHPRQIKFWEQGYVDVVLIHES
jgi:hypothetical protein